LWPCKTSHLKARKQASLAKQVRTQLLHPRRRRLLLPHFPPPPTRTAKHVLVSTATMMRRQALQLLGRALRTSAPRAPPLRRPQVSTNPRSPQICSSPVPPPSLTRRRCVSYSRGSSSPWEDGDPVERRRGSSPPTPLRVRPRLPARRSVVRSPRRLRLRLPVRCREVPTPRRPRRWHRVPVAAGRMGSRSRTRGSLSEEG
jgi:hypothetical protein